MMVFLPIAAAKLEATAYQMQGGKEVQPALASAPAANAAAKPISSPASGSWLSSVSAPLRQHFFLTAEEARRKLDAYFDQQKVRRSWNVPRARHGHELD